jgi:hypothetical protein
MRLPVPTSYVVTVMAAMYSGLFHSDGLFPHIEAQFEDVVSDIVFGLAAGVFAAILCEAITELRALFSRMRG